MKVFEQAYAKINLYLDVSQKRDDGYHDLTTVMHQITLFDELYIEACDAQQIQITLEVDGGDDIPCDSRNLVYRAIDLLLNELQRPMQVHVKIMKRIPSMAGLGGGSSDAAAAMRGMNRILKSPFSDEQLEHLAAQIGSDCPFFIRKISALCLGRGEILKEFTPELKGSVVVVEGKEPSSTKEAFSMLDNMRKKPRQVFDFSVFSFDDVYNCFEEPISLCCLSVKEHLFLLRQENPRCAAMSGSGSAVFAIFETYDKAKTAFNKFINNGSVAYLCELL